MAQSALVAVASDSSARRFTRLNPVTGEVASQALAMTPGGAIAVADAAAAFPAWAATGPNARRTRLNFTGSTAIGAA